MNPPLAAPQSFDSLQKAISERFPELSKRLKQIASYALDNPSDVALETITEVARRAGVQPSSLVRFAKLFGFSGYRDMQRVFRLRLAGALPDYKERLRALGKDAAGEDSSSISALLDHFVQADIVGLKWLSEQPRIAERLERALELIADADTVYLVAHRRSFPIVCYLSYALSQMHVKNVLVDGVGGMFSQQAGHATSKDLVLAVSSKAYSPDVVEAVRTAAERGVPIVAITDSPVSPLVEHAEVSLELQEASVHMFRSLAVPMTFAITLVVGLGRVLEARRSNGNHKKSTKKGAHKQFAERRKLA